MANIFFPELCPFRAKADPAPLPIVVSLARRLRNDLGRYDRKRVRFVRAGSRLIRLWHLERARHGLTVVHSFLAR